MDVKGDSAIQCSILTSWITFRCLKCVHYKTGTLTVSVALGSDLIYEMQPRSPITQHINMNMIIQQLWTVIYDPLSCQLCYLFIVYFMFLSNCFFLISKDFYNVLFKYRHLRCISFQTKLTYSFVKFYIYFIASVK